MDDRLRGLVEAGIALSSELSLEAVLQKIVEAAAELTGARYAALGVIDRTGTALERFLVTGLDEEQQRAIGEPPRGRGILGALIRDARPLRLDEIGSDPRSVGFPPNHPPMRTFLGVPILLRGVAYGNLYLTEKKGGSFTAEDEDVVTLLAAQAAVSIENARLYESATRWLRQMEIASGRPVTRPSTSSPTSCDARRGSSTAHATTLRPSRRRSRTMSPVTRRSWTQTPSSDAPAFPASTFRSSRAECTDRSRSTSIESSGSSSRGRRADTTNRRVPA